MRASNAHADALSALQCWRVAKPACDKRAEIRGCEGYKQKEGETYYFGWCWRISMPATKLGHHGEHHGACDLLQFVCILSCLCDHTSLS